MGQWKWKEWRWDNEHEESEDEGFRGNDEAIEFNQLIMDQATNT